MTYLDPPTRISQTSSGMTYFGPPLDGDFFANLDDLFAGFGASPTEEEPDSIPEKAPERVRKGLFPLQVQDQVFATSAALERHMRAFLSGYEVGQVLRFEDYAFLLILIGAVDPEPFRVFGDGVLRFQVESEGEFGSKVLLVVRRDRSFMISLSRLSKGQPCTSDRGVRLRTEM